ncbi:MAG: hypothetical protein JJU36_03910 [Phycisphaeraceae bacterium]|nr:hypothetical protein [Phycisphaeraceae bacterium]
MNSMHLRWLAPLALWFPVAWLLTISAGREIHGAEVPDVAGQVIVLTLEDAVERDRPLRLHLDVTGSRINAAFVSGANAVLHDVDARSLTIADRRIEGEIEVTINPDNFVPTDGQPVSCRFTLKVSRAEDGITGEFEGMYGESARKGAVTGQVTPRPDYAESYRLRTRFFGALHRLYVARGPSWRYALDMNLSYRANDGRAVGPRFESIVPDYRRYSAIVEHVDLSVEGNEFKGEFRARVDYGGQGAARHFRDPIELHTFTLRGKVIGDVVGGTYEVKVGEDHKGTNLRFAGSLDFAPPPDPRQSLAFIRLHDAMKEGPVLLHLSLANENRIHGLAYASGYNHQPHNVDASGLTLTDNALRGRVNVSIVPDVYKTPEWFTLPYELDVRIEGDSIIGSFTGDDRDNAVKGTATGELRAKRATERPIRRDAITAVELQMGYSLHAAGRATGEWANVPINHSHIRFALDEGKVKDVRVFNPVNARTFSAEVVESSLKIDGDRLTGSVSYDLRSEVVQPGRHVFTFEAIIDGDRLIGFWRATRDGQHILTKSAKMGGRVLVE